MTDLTIEAPLANQPTGRPTRKMNWGAAAYALAAIAVSVANTAWPGAISTEAGLAIAGAIFTLTGYRVRDRLE